MSDVSCLLLNQNDSLGNKILAALSSREIQVHAVTNIDYFLQAVEEVHFDLFVWVAPRIENNYSIIERSLENVPHLLSCVFTEEPLESENFDFICSYSDLKTDDSLNNFIANLIRLLKRLKTQRELSSLLLHDLRTPLQNLSSYLDILTKGIFGYLNEGQLKILKTINAQGEMADELIQELSQLISSQKKRFFIDRVKTDIIPVVNESLRALWIWADRKNIKIQSFIAKDLPELMIDPLAIKRVLFNLIFNAIKFSPENGTVRLKVNLEGSKPGKQKILFQIVDSGPGIPPEHLSNIFEKYYRLDKTAIHLKGMGLGLYIAKLFIEVHGGTIGVYNNREGGATFYFTLPVER